MEEKKKGNGIFLGIVAVATLIVAIIGATFAYFSITAQSNANAVNLSSYEFTASLSVNPVAPTGNFKGLIPMDPDATVTNGGGATNLQYAVNQSAQMGATYQGQVIFETNSGNQLTGTFTVS